MTSGVSCQIAVYTPLDPLSIVASSVSELHLGGRSIGKFGGRMGLVACRFKWMVLGIKSGYLKETLLLPGLAREWPGFCSIMEVLEDGGVPPGGY